MFKRRTPLNFIQNARQILWPKMGWWRLLKYYRVRIIRLSSTAESIAINLAGGSAMSFTPFFGIHVFTALGFAWLIGARMNVVAAMVGTFIGNPWTFPFLLYSSYRVGGWFLNIFGDHTSSPNFNPNTVEEQSENLLSYFWDNFTEIFVPTAIGGTLLAIASFPLYYMLYVYLVRGAQRARKLRIKKKQRRQFNKNAMADKEPEDFIK